MRLLREEVQDAGEEGKGGALPLPGVHGGVQEGGLAL